MQIIDAPMSLADLVSLAENLYGDMVKAVADVRNGVLAIDAELHSDLESLLLQNGSAQEDLWGFNIYPAMYGSDDFVEFDSLINIRPRQNNPSRDVEDPHIREAIITLTGKFFIE